MAYPYKKMTSQDCDYIRSVTAPDRVWVGEEIASEYYRDEMPEYGVYQPDLYVEVVNKEEVSAIMAYAYKENIPVVCRGAGTGLAGRCYLQIRRHHVIHHADEQDFSDRPEESDDHRPAGCTVD